MAANTPRNNQITCIDDITTHDLLDGCFGGVGAEARPSYDESGIFRANTAESLYVGKDRRSNHY
jgi:hypothetical protein